MEKMRSPKSNSYDSYYPIHKLHRTSTHERSRRFRTAIESTTLDEVNLVCVLPWEPLSTRHARHERRLLRALANNPGFIKKLNIKIPKLLAQAGRRTHTCYNEDTRGEIHILLQALLKKVDDMLHALVDAPSEDTTTEGGEENSCDGGDFP